MIMPRGEELLSPVNPLFVLVTLFTALALSLIPLGPLPWMPDLMLLLLAFWGVHQPQRIGMGWAFSLGLCIDVYQGSLLGQHAIAYAGVLFCTQLFHRRLLWFGTLTQAGQMLGLFVGAHALQLAIRMLIGGDFPGWSLVLAPCIEAALWPLASWVLLSPQRRPLDPDENRPL